MDAGAVTLDLVRKWSRPRLGIPDNTLGDLLLEHKAPGHHGDRAARPTQTLGRLGRLPLELLTAVVLGLDLVSIAAVRRVNRRARQAVDAVPQYGRLARHGAHLLRAILATDARFFSLAALHATLCTQRCVACGDFGGYLYIITCVRVCYLCFTQNRRFLPLRGKQASSAMPGQLSQKALQERPHIRSIRGRYAVGGHRGTSGILSSVRISLWDRTAVLPAEASVREPPDRRCNDPRRFMAIVPVPYFEPPWREAHWGVYCVGCRESHDDETYFRKQYSTKGFLEHVAHYGAIQQEDVDDRPKHVPARGPTRDSS